MAEQEKAQAKAVDLTTVVKCGISNATVYGVGKSVADLRGQCKKAVNISPDMKAMVDGIAVEDEATFIISEGQEVEFVKLAGQKGKSYRR
jgi:hypothetical protein